MPSGSSASVSLSGPGTYVTTVTGEVGGGLRLRAEVVVYADYPAIEWTVYFTFAAGGSGAAGESGILEGVNAIDAFIGGEGAALEHNSGDFYHADGYTVGLAELPEGASFNQAPNGGRPCDGAFPYQRLTFDGHGVNVSIGWPGQWSCEYRGERGGVRLRAGQQVTHTVLRSGETLRTPRMSLVFFAGGAEEGANVWRRWYLAHVLPSRIGGKVAPAMAFCNNAGGEEFQEADEKNQLEAIARLRTYTRHGDVWWIDAGWYPCYREDGTKSWPITGTWKPDPARFPNGLAPVGKAAAEAGMDFLVWFEPERVHPGTWLDKEHPEWLLFNKDNDPSWDNRLLNLTDPDCHRWLRETVAGLIKESGIKCYRQDFNFEPLMYWRNNEAEDRRGMLENLYVQGYLAYWDYLLREVPDLWIDSCASGGRRNDLETMRRSVPLHPTDYGYGYHHINQSYRHTLHAWLPYTRGWATSWDVGGEYVKDVAYAADLTPNDNYKTVNGFGVLSFTDMGQFGKSPEMDAYMDRMLGVWERYADMALNSDFYALTPNHRSFGEWTVFQFDRPERGDGAFHVLRNNKAPQDTLTVYPKGVSGDLTLTNEETGETMVAKDVGAAGVTFSQPMRSGSIWFYGKAERA
ncbi:MAG: alpha-galactosidase [Oscillospiraceae bacterium]|nr:alpha-galactosidase [Oscillospiraceae bacterium]